MDVTYLNESPAEAQAWNRYVDQSASATSDHLWEWRRVLSGAFHFRPYYLGAWEGDRLVGILPLFLVPRGFGRSALSSIPFGNYGGICADSEEATQALLQKAQELLRQLRCEYLELRHKSPLPLPGLSHQQLHSRFVFPLNGNPEQHLRDLGNAHRKKFQKATRNGLSVVSSRDVQQFYPVHLHTAQRHGTPCFPRSYFQLILREFSDKAKAHLVLLREQVIAYDLILLFKESYVCQFNGSLTSFLSFYPNNLLFWHAIEEGCSLGKKEVDYCRSRTDSGAAAFKRGLRFVEEPLGYQYVLPGNKELPQRNPSNPKYQWAIRTWKALPVALTQCVGPSLVRYFA